MLDPIEECVPQGCKVSQDYKTEALSLLPSLPVTLDVLSKTSNPLFYYSSCRVENLWEACLTVAMGGILMVEELTSF